MTAPQVVDGCISVYEVMRQHGISLPAKCWKDLLRKHIGTLPEHTLKQFPMRDGRKGRLTPAVRKEDCARLVEHFGSPVHRTPLQQSALATLRAAFLDQQPVWDVRCGKKRIDLYFQQCRLAIVLSPEATGVAGHLANLTEPPLQWVTVNVQEQSFNVGTLILEIRLWLAEQHSNSGGVLLPRQLLGT